MYKITNLQFQIGISKKARSDFRHPSPHVLIYVTSPLSHVMRVFVPNRGLSAARHLIFPPCVSQMVFWCRKYISTTNFCEYLSCGQSPTHSTAGTDGIHPLSHYLCPVHPWRRNSTGVYLRRSPPSG